MNNKQICILGDILIDYTISDKKADKMRLGGILHAGRGAWAIDTPYQLCYFAPSYLDEEIEKFTSYHNGTVLKIGNVVGTPNVILIKEVKEVGDQGYEFILRDARKYTYDLATFQSNVNQGLYSDILLFSGGYDLKEVLDFLNPSDCHIHLDISNDINDLSILSSLKNKFETIFISTSSHIFLNTFNKDINALLLEAKKYSKKLVFKENRGGSRYFEFATNQIINVPSQTRKIEHSVGVGDNYNLSYIHKIKYSSPEDALNFASWFAMEYALTTFPDDFKKSIARLNKIRMEDLKKMGGVFLPWEKRSLIDIYIAAPDFNYVNKEKLDLLVQALRYHNFNPRLPIQEHGQLTIDATKNEKSVVCSRDIELLFNCKILIAVMLFDDPGTLIEIGVAIAGQIPTIVYDPYNKASNCILTELPNVVSNDLDEIISQVFILSSKI